MISLVLMLLIESISNFFVSSTLKTYGDVGRSVS